MQIPIQIKADSRPVVLRTFLGDQAYQSGSSIQTPGGGELIWDGRVEKSWETVIIGFILSIPGSVAVNLLSNWLYDRLKKSKSKEITIYRKTYRVIDLNSQRIQEIIEETIKEVHDK